jgi:hypothetical protein
MTKGFRSFAAAATIAVSSLAMAPAMAGPAEMDLLSGYVGNWKGNGVMVGGQQPEPFRCRMQVQKGNQAKVNFAGRCTLVNFNLSVSGTIAFNDKSRRYEAAMSSNAGFSGVAAGRIIGDTITFDLAEKQIDKGGNDMRIGSKVSLVADTINIDFEIEFNNSGNVLTAKVPFKR